MHRHLINDPREIVNEALEGFAIANSELVVWERTGNFVRRAQPKRSPRVSLISGGGSGHEPLHTGFVGEGMLDAAVPGAIFASPSAAQVEAATQAVDCGHGVLHIVKNYTGDVLNFGIAAESAGENGISTSTVVVDDDVATATTEPGSPGRRGTAAVVAVEKICGAAAERGANLAALATLGRTVSNRARSMALALGAGTHPGESRPSFDLPADEVELGVGIHGERGVDRVSFAPAQDLAPLLVGPILEDLGLKRGDAVVAIVNGLGSTHSLELSVMFLELTRILAGNGIEISRSLVGEYVTSLDMAGCSMTLVHVDEELTGLWDDPVRTPALNW